MGGRIHWSNPNWRFSADFHRLPPAIRAARSIHRPVFQPDQTVNGTLASQIIQKTKRHSAPNAGPNGSEKLSYVGRFRNPGGCGTVAVAARLELDGVGLIQGDVQSLGRQLVQRDPVPAEHLGQSCGRCAQRVEAGNMVAGCPCSRCPPGGSIAIANSSLPRRWAICWLLFPHRDSQLEPFANPLELFSGRSMIYPRYTGCRERCI